MQVLTGKDITVEKIDELLKGSATSQLTLNEGRDGYSTHRLCKRCSAMANVGGGLMLLGVTAKRPHKVVGSQAYRNPAKLEKLIARRLYPPIRVEVVPVEHPQGRVMCIIVPEVNCGPVRYKLVWYTRSGARTVRMSDHEVRRLLINENPIHWLEGDCLWSLTAEEVLDLLDIEGFYRMLEKQPPSDPNLAMEDLARARMVALEQENTGFSVTRMGALLLAKSIKRFPADIAWKSVRMVKYGGKTRRSAVLSDQRFDQGHASGLDAIVEMAVARMHGPRSRKKDQGGAADFPYRAAVRELLLNAIIHQDFDSNEETVLEVFADRVEIANPGESLISPDYMLVNCAARNGQLMAAMRKLGLAEYAGRGINIAVQAMEDNRAFPLEIESKDGFTKITLFYGKADYSSMSKSDRKAALYQHCLFRQSNRQDATNASARGRFNLAAKRQGEVVSLLKELVTEGKIKSSYERRESRKWTVYLPSWYL